MKKGMPCKGYNEIWEGKEWGGSSTVYFLDGSIASPFLQAMILIFWAWTISFDSILKEGFLTMNVQTSSHRRYVFRWP